MQFELSHSDIKKALTAYLATTYDIQRDFDFTIKTSRKEERTSRAIITVGAVTPATVVESSVNVVVEPLGAIPDPVVVQVPVTDQHEDVEETGNTFKRLFA
jgi:hypothetical protein